MDGWGRTEPDRLTVVLFDIGSGADCANTSQQQLLTIQQSDAFSEFGQGWCFQPTACYQPSVYEGFQILCRQQ